MSEPDALATPPPEHETTSNTLALSPGNSGDGASEAGRGQAQSKLEIHHASEIPAHGSSLERPEAPENDDSIAYEEFNTHKPAEPFVNGFIQLNTHDTSFVNEHIPSIEKFGQDLQVAIHAAWPTRRGSRYEEAHVLLLSWEDDNLGVEQEIRRLKHVFSVLYRFDVQEFRIPSKTPGKATTSRVSDFLENDSPSSLLIVYYAGHARLSNQTNEPPIWAATDKVGSPMLPCGGVQQLLEEAASDVLLLYDSCHSSHPAINAGGQGVTEVIAACGFETQAPAVGPHSFTNSLIRELEEAFIGPPISVAELHVRVIGSLKNWKPALLRDKDGNLWTDENGRPRFEVHKRRTPVHCFLTNETPYRSIMLSPLPSRLSHAAVTNIAGATSTKDGTTNSTAPSQNFSEEAPSTGPTSVSGSREQDQSLQVLLAVRLDDDFLDDNGADDGNKLRNWCEWLKSLPNGAKDVSVQGVYQSFSTLVLLNLPLLLWNLLPSNSAYSFVGFIQSKNLVRRLLNDESKAKEDIKIAGLPSVRSDSVPADVDVAFARSALEIIKDGLSQAMRQQAEKPEASAGKSKAGIKFKDAVGRKFAFPFSEAKTWQGMEQLIREAFLHVEGLGPHVAEGHYDLIGPNGEIILPTLWEKSIQPGWSITMHMWPMPEPRPPRPFPNKPGFPPTPANSRPNSIMRSIYVPGEPPPPPPPSNWPGGPPPPKFPPPGPGSAPPIVEEASMPPPSGLYKKSVEKNPKETQPRKSSIYTNSNASDDDREEIMKLVSKFVKARRIFKVGRMSFGNSRATYQVSPRKEALELLNAYGRKLVAEAGKVDLESLAD